MRVSMAAVAPDEGVAALSVVAQAMAGPRRCPVQGYRRYEEEYDDACF